MVDLKVLVRSFNCESRACYVGNPRESFFFRARGREFFIRESWIFLIIIIVYITACSGLAPSAAQGPRVRQENGTAHLPFPS